jgi:GntR family transcriptional regulator/MocR family aminotransferase
MLPFNTLIVIERQNNVPVYTQVCNGLILLIRDGKITPGTFLPGTREMADLLNMHRKTVINAYDELAAQGWVESVARKGFRVIPDLPVMKPRSFHPKNNFPSDPAVHEDLPWQSVPDRPGIVAVYTDDAIVINDGFPDTALTPYDHFLKQYRLILKDGNHKQLSRQKDHGGIAPLKTATSNFLNQTRGLNISNEQLMMTRGAQMAIYIAAALLIKPGDNVIVTEPNYFMADDIFRKMGAVLHRVPVDEDGMDVTFLEALLKTATFKMLYIIPHHHHPTTVTMSTSRRIQLLSLVREYRLWVIEDDYDYDFHYRNSPILPLASAGHEGRIIYIGSYTKLLGPSFRIGYLVAGKQFVGQAIAYRKLMDIRGDFMMESALAALIENGELGRHIKRSKKIYAARLQATVGQLRNRLGHALSFDEPQGGMALWLRFRENYPLGKILSKAAAQQLHLLGSAYFKGHNTDYNSIRFGFASLSDTELERAIHILENILSPTGR